MVLCVKPVFDLYNINVSIHLLLKYFLVDFLYLFLITLKSTSHQVIYFEFYQVENTFRIFVLLSEIRQYFDDVN